MSQGGIVTFWCGPWNLNSKKGHFWTFLFLSSNARILIKTFRHVQDVALCVCIVFCIENVEFEIHSVL